MSSPGDLSPPNRTRRRWIRWLLIASFSILVLATLTIGLLPSWLSTDSGRDFWTGWVDERANGDFSVADAQLSWVDGVALRTVELTNPTGFEETPMLRLRSAQLDFGVGAMLVGDYDLVMTVAEPELTIVRNADGRLNVMEWWPLPDRSDRDHDSLHRERRRPGLQLDIHVTDGRLVFDDRKLNSLTVLEDVQLECTTAHAQAPVLWNVTAQLAGKHSGALSMSGELVLPATDWLNPEGVSGSMELTLQEISSENWLPKRTEDAVLEALAATMAGTMRLGWSDGRLTPELDLVIRDLSVRAEALPQPFQAPETKVAMRASVPLSDEPLSWERFSVDSPLLGIESSGKMARWRSQSPEMSSRWKVRYDLAALPPSWREQLSEWGITGSPRGLATLQVSSEEAGLSSNAISLDGQWTLGNLSFKGNRLEDTQVDIGWSGGQLDLAPRGALNGGPFRFTTSIRPSQQSFELEADLSEVSIEKGLTEALQYAVPFLAGAQDVATTTGRLAGRLRLAGQGFEWSELSQTLNGSGSLALADLEVGGSALLGEIGRSIQLSRLGSFQELTSDFVIREGRVFNEDLRVNSRQVSFYLEGSTGFDGSIDYAVSTELVAELIRKQSGDLAKLLGQAKGLSRIPLSFGGTLQNPTVHVELEQLAQSLGKTLEDTLGEAVDRAVDEALDRATGGGKRDSTDAAREALEEVLGGKTSSPTPRPEGRQQDETGVIESLADQLERQRYDKQVRRAREKAEAILKVCLDQQGRLSRQRLQGDAAAKSVVLELLRLPVAPKAVSVDDHAVETIALRVAKYNLALALVAASAESTKAPTFENAAQRSFDFGDEGTQTLGDYRERIPTQRDPRLEFALAFSGDYPMPAGKLLTGESLVPGSVTAAQHLLARTTRVEGEELAVFWYVYARAQTLTGADPNQDPDGFRRGVLTLLQDFLPADHPARRLITLPETRLVRTTRY